MQNGKIRALHAGKPKHEIFSNIDIFSAMDKQAKDNVTVTKSGIIGDGVGNVKFHGGPDRALCFYSL